MTELNVELETRALKCVKTDVVRSDGEVDPYKLEVSTRERNRKLKGRNVLMETHSYTQKCESTHSTLRVLSSRCSRLYTAKHK